MSAIEKSSKLLSKHYREGYSSETTRLINTARFSLMFGPIPPDTDIDGDGWKYPGDSVASDELQKLYSDLPAQAWVDLSAEYISESEPEAGYTDPDTGEYEEYYTDETYHFDRRQIAVAIFGKDVVDNLIQA